MSSTSTPKDAAKMDLESNSNTNENKEEKKSKSRSWNPLRKFFHPTPAPPAKFADSPIPDHQANVFQKVIFSWIDPMMSVGFSRPLEKEDLWTMDPERQASHLGDQIETAFYSRCPPRKRPPKFKHSSKDQGKVEDDDDEEELDERKKTSPQSRSSNEGSSGSDDEEQVDGVVRSALEAGDNLPSTARDMEAPAVAGPGTGAEARAIGWFSRLKGEKRAQTQEGEKGAASKLESKAEEALKGKRPKYDSSLALALHSVFFWQFWIAGFFNLIGQGLLVTSPLVSKALIEFLTASYAYGQVPEGTVIPGLAKPSAGRGWGLAVGLWAMQQFASFATNQYYFHAMQVGFKARAAVISNIFRKALRLSAKSRLKHTTGQLTTMISADCTRLDMSFGFAHQAWIGPVEIIVALALLINTMGYSALVAVAVLVFGTPVQAIIVARMIKARRGAVKVTDRRVRLMQEIFTGIKYIVLFSHQTPYIEKIIKLRREELHHIKSLAFYRSLTFSIVYFVPVLASVLAFITYHATGHPLNPAVIFSSLQFINVLRMPLVLFPLAASSVGDAYVALGRISKVLVAEEVLEDYSTSDPDYGLRVKGSFTWETAEKPVQDDKKKQFKGGKTGFESKEAKAEKLSKEEIKKNKADAKQKKLDTKAKSKAAKIKRKEIRRRDEAGEEDVFTDEEEEQDLAVKASEEKKKADVFKLKEVDVTIKKGELVCVVGPIGSGKSSFLQALAGEMRKTDGNVSFGGSVAYSPQQPWIQNLTLRQNITFGLPDDQRRFQNVVSSCALKQDIDMLPDGESTELGERGVTISGGQKARVSLARTAYFDADVILLDDVFSAVDSGVKRHILHNCILDGPMAGKTRILVTHSLHVLPYADRILYIEDGVFLEQGTYHDLLERKGRFSQLIENYGTEEKDVEEKKAVTKGPNDGKVEEELAAPGKKLMTDEERAEGAVPLSVYNKYLTASGSFLWFPFLLLLLTLTQVATVGNNLVLGFWTGNKISGWESGQYIGLYAGFGIAQAVLTFCTCFAVAYCGFYASLTLFSRALKGTMLSPLAFHDTTPVGRIISRLSKDIDTLDFQLPSNFFSFSLQFSTVLGTVGLTIYAYNYLGIMFPPLFFIYFFIQDYYRRTSREAKRLDSLLRSYLYGSYMEALNGLSTIRAFRTQAAFIKKTETLVDTNNSAYFLTIAVQRWLSIRMDFLGNSIILALGLIAVGYRSSASPSTLGVALTYALSITQSLSQMVQQLAQLEQDMNTVERVIFYADLPVEGDFVKPNDPENNSWPSRGEVEFKNVSLRYRPELPLVLNDVSFKFKAGERVGVVGRTGAGKSSLLAALFHTVPLSQGQILIDGVDIATIGLDALRKSLALCPQDAVIFDATLRENLSPDGAATDQQMYAALRAVGLITSDEEATASTSTKLENEKSKTRFHLDLDCREDSFSAGQKQLLGLARALIKESKIIVLDEATAATDVESDSNIQHMIQALSGVSLISIAHRLDTVCFYDKVLVMKDGQVAELDTPLTLFDDEHSIFRSMCDQASLTRERIVKIREEAESHSR